jgi:hypothetical protein
MIARAMLTGIEKPMPTFPARARNDRRVDADELALQVHERRRVAGIDRSIRLDEVLERRVVEAAAPERADDAGRHAVREPNGLPIATT